MQADKGGIHVSLGPVSGKEIQRLILKEILG